MIRENKMRRMADQMANTTVDYALVKANKTIKELQDKLKQYEWQPMETAPKDGTKVLLIEKATDYQSEDEDEYDYIFTGFYHPGGEYGKPHWECWEYEAFPHNPIGWMPLPKPPEEI